MHLDPATRHFGPPEHFVIVRADVSEIAAPTLQIRLLLLRNGDQNVDNLADRRNVASRQSELRCSRVI